MTKFLKVYWQEIFLTIFIIIAAVLRFYNIDKLQFFTYDQSRDALFVKRMIVDHEFRLLGTQTSLPGMYLPPFYFYTIAPVLWLFGLNPVGVDIYSALIGVLTVPLIYFIGNKIFGKPAGLFSAGLFAVSPLIVELTRRSWNPNTLPFFIAIVFYFLYQFYQEGKTRDFLLAFGFYGYCLSLHFGAWTLLPLFVFTWFWGAIKGKVGKLGLLGGLGLLGFFVSPLLVFELRHNFFLISQAKMFFFDGGHVGPTGNFFEPFLTSLIAIFVILISGKIMVGYGAPLEFSGQFKDLFALSQPISVVAQKPFSLSFQWWGLLFFLTILIMTIFVLQKEKKMRLALVMLWVWILWGIFASRMYSGKFFFFYYLFLFPAPVLLFGFLAKKIWDYKFLRIVAGFSLFWVVFFHLYYTTVLIPGWRDINDLKKVGLTIAENISDKTAFNLATIQKEVDRWDRNAVDYRYFVESFSGKRALDWYPENYQQAEILFVIDETGKADVLSSSIMEIKEFNPQKIIDRWSLDNGILIYKLGK
ncbi:MAG: glycosyltransferase family 39 protein [Patescibacteria group bacterium]|nr:glycosyltransferase family 39 protein [Patescibacteria group bacterium]